VRVVLELQLHRAALVSARDARVIDLVCILSVFVALEAARVWVVYRFTRIACRHPMSGPGSP
jgi:hypothetical protein